jgi:hypothetical protein
MEYCLANEAAGFDANADLIGAGRNLGLVNYEPAWRSDNSTPPPKLSRRGTAPPFVIFTAQYLNSGIFPKGSSAGLVSMFAAAS